MSGERGRRVRLMDCRAGVMGGKRGRQATITTGRARSTRVARRCRCPPAVADRGAGTVWTLGLVAVIWLVAVAVMVAGGIRAARHRVHTAADLAALAAASHAAAGSAAACRRALTVVVGSGGRLRSCTLHGDIADVTVSVHVDNEMLKRIWPGSVEIVGSARAGPTLPVGGITGYPGHQ